MHVCTGMRTPDAATYLYNQRCRPCWIMVTITASRRVRGTITTMRSARREWQVQGFNLRALRAANLTQQSILLSKVRWVNLSATSHRRIAQTHRVPVSISDQHKLPCTHFTLTLHVRLFEFTVMVRSLFSALARNGLSGEPDS
jgi:hypothetical protein